MSEMNAIAPNWAAKAGDWHGAGSTAGARRRFSWRHLVWALVFPVKRHRISVTVSGVFLIGLSLGIGTAAYNTASNILFITLSLLLACLLLSGLLSWINLTGVGWRLRPSRAWRAGHETLVTVEVKNAKTWLPTYGLFLDLKTHLRQNAEAEPEVPAGKVRAALAAAEKAITRGQLFLRERLEPQGQVALDWVHKPTARGEAVLELEAVGSLFPFGFLRKSVGTDARQQVLVWPAQVDYTWRGAVSAQAGTQGRRTARAGAGDDLFALRKYNAGDSHRLVHWKASARLGRLMVRQFAAESLDGFVLQVDASAALWPRPEQFELLCSFAGTLAEDLFATGRLQAVSINGEPGRETRRVRDVEAFWDRLATLQPAPGGPPAGHPFPVSNRNLITFAPQGARGITAHVDGIPTASA